jgi:hypothetical protein
MRGLLTHLENGSYLTIHDRAAAAKATSAQILSARLEAGEPVDISRIVDAAPSIEHALAMLETSEGAEEA